MRNLHPGTCYRCGEWCDVGDGHFERLGSKWRVQHAECAIARRGQPDPIRQNYSNCRDEILAAGTGLKAQRARRRIRARAALNGGKANG